MSDFPSLPTAAFDFPTPEDLIREMAADDDFPMYLEYEEEEGFEVAGIFEEW
jgi:hypothetical protein